MCGALAVALALGTVACAGFTRGERWDDTDDATSGDGPATTSAPPADGGDDDDDGTATTGPTPGSTSDVPPDTEGPGDAPSFAADIYPLLLAGCERCHSPDGQANDTGLVYVEDDVEGAYETTLDFVDLAAPSQSRLLSKTAGQGHIGGTIFDRNSAEYAAIADWIAQGANP